MANREVVRRVSLNTKSNLFGNERENYTCCENSRENKIRILIALKFKQEMKEILASLLIAVNAGKLRWTPTVSGNGLTLRRTSVQICTVGVFFAI